MSCDICEPNLGASHLLAEFKFCFIFYILFFMQRIASIIFALAVVAFAAPAALAGTPVIPATPTISDWYDGNESDGTYVHTLTTSIPKVDTNGNALNENNLYYIVWYRKGTEVTPFLFTNPPYTFHGGNIKVPRLDEMPYAATASRNGSSFTDDAIEYGGRLIGLYSEVPDEIGLQSVYYVDGYRCFSDIFWHKPDLTHATRIETLDHHHNVIKGFAYKITPEENTKVTYDQIGNITIEFTNFSQIDVLDAGAITVTQNDMPITAAVTHEKGSNRVNIAVSDFVYLGESQSGYFDLSIKRRAIKGYHANGDFEYNEDLMSMKWFYEIVPKPVVVNYTTNPAQGVVTSDQLVYIDVTVTNFAFAAISGLTVTSPTSPLVTFTHDGEPAWYHVEQTSAANVIRLTVNAGEYASGKYVLRFAPGALDLSETWTDDESGNAIKHNSEELVMQWTIESNADFSSYSISNTEPYCTQFSGIELHFPHLKNIDPYISNKSNISVTHNGEELPFGLSAYYSSSNGYCVLNVNTTQSHSAPGEYVVTLNKNSIVGTSDGTHYFYLREPIQFKKVIIDQNALLEYTVSPAQGNVAALSNINITFPNADELITIPTQYTLKRGADVIPFTTSTSGNVLTVKPNEPQTTLGSYVLTIPAGWIGARLNDMPMGQNYTTADDIVLTWTVIKNNGDVNGDGTTNVSDVTALVNQIVGSGAQGAMSDINADGEVNVSDVTALVNLIINGGSGGNEVSNQTFKVNGVSFDMIVVEGGSFSMGATEEQGSDAYTDESPVHQVKLSSFCIGKTEVTQELWKAVMGSNPSYYSGNNLPVEQVSWDDCQEFITKLNALTGKSFRLPTEAEWEYAARGGNKSQGYKYSGSNTIDDVAWYYSNCGATRSVATKAANELGIFDMSGNVVEWCNDWYGAYSSNAQTNPTGADSGTTRVCRGGGGSTNARWNRVSMRLKFGPAARANNRGMRLAL